MNIKIGIYKILSPSGKVYIGQSWNIKKRFKYYKYKNCKNQYFIKRSLDKYGYDNHIFEIIHELPEDITQSLLDTYEQFYMDRYRECGIKLLNLREGGSRGKHTEESIERMRIKRRDFHKNNPESSEKHIKSISQYNFKGDLIKHWKSLKEAVKYNEIPSSSISAVLKSRLKSYKGFIFKYNEGKNKIEPYRIDKRTYSKGKIYQYNTENELVKEWENRRTASNILGIRYRTLCNKIDHPTFTFKGYKWKTN